MAGNRAERFLPGSLPRTIRGSYFVLASTGCGKSPSDSRTVRPAASCFLKEFVQKRLRNAFAPYSWNCPPSRLRRSIRALQYRVVVSGGAPTYQARLNSRGCPRFPDIRFGFRLVPLPAISYKSFHYEKKLASKTGRQKNLSKGA